MFTVPKTPAWSVLDTLEGLFKSHPVSIFGASRSRAAEREAQDALEQMPPHLRDDLGLPAVKRPKGEHPALTRARNRASRWGS